MDSDNSGSLQSSSGGDEDYDLRAALNSRPISNLHLPQPQPETQTQPSPSLFDHNALSAYSNILTNMPWPGSASLMSDPYPHTTLSGSSPSFPRPPVALDFKNPPPAARNPKKRSRASRRAPTTVLTTDASNFRAMVQEFTGIPAQPFNYSSFPRARFDLLGTVSSSVDAAHNRHPFIQKFQSPASPFFATPPLSFSPLNSNARATNSNPNLLNFKRPIPQNFSNPLISTLLQTTPNSGFSNSPVPKPRTPDYLSEIKIGGLDEFGLTSEMNLTPSDLILPQTDGNAEKWRNPELKRGEEQPHVMPISESIIGNYSPQANFHAATEPEKAALPGQGTTDSWICSSD